MLPKAAVEMDVLCEGHHQKASDGEAATARNTLTSH